MSGFSYHVRVNHISPAIIKLQSLGADTTPIMRAMGTTFKSITEGNFNSVGARFRPKRWPNLLTVTMDKTREPPEFKFQRTVPSILHKSGTLQQSFHLEVTRSSATLRSPMIYAAIHQFGGVIRAKKSFLRFQIPYLSDFWFLKSVTIPARPFFPIENGRLTPAAEQLIVRAGMRAIARAVKPTRE